MEKVGCPSWLCNAACSSGPGPQFFRGECIATLVNLSGRLLKWPRTSVLPNGKTYATRSCLWDAACPTGLESQFYVGKRGLPGGPSGTPPVRVAPSLGFTNENVGCPEVRFGRLSLLDAKTPLCGLPWCSPNATRASIPCIQRPSLFLVPSLRPYLR